MIDSDTYSARDHYLSHGFPPYLLAQNWGVLLSTEAVRSTLGFEYAYVPALGTTYSMCEPRVDREYEVSIPLTIGSHEYGIFQDLSAQVSGYNTLKWSSLYRDLPLTLDDAHQRFGLSNLITRVLFLLMRKGIEVASKGYTEDDSYVLQLFENDDFMLIELHPSNEITYSRRFARGGREFGDLTLDSLSQKLDERAFVL